MENRGMTKIKTSGKILIWLGFLAFFIYSFQTIMDLEDLGNPRRQENVLRILTALSKPNLFEYEYETRETSIVLERSCSQPDAASQIEQVSGGKIVLEFKCSSIEDAILLVHGSGFQPGLTGHIAWDANSRNVEYQTFTNFPFKADKEGNFLITANLSYAGRGLIGREIFVIEHPSKTFLGFSEISHLAIVKMWETVQMGFLATILGSLLAIPFAFLGTRVFTRWGHAVRILLHPLFAVIRSVHPLITVLVVVVFVGLGSSAGVLAITLFSTAVLFVKFSDYADEYKTLEWPALLKVYFPGIAFKYFPTNILIATVIGFRGGGGIGFILQQDLNLLYYRGASVSLLAIIITITSLDLISRAVWHKIQRSRITALKNEEISSRI